MVEGTGLENRHAETYRGFESHPLRQEKAPTGRKTSRGFLVKERWGENPRGSGVSVRAEREPSHPLRQEKAPTDRKISRGFLLIEERWDGIILSVYQRQTSHSLSASLF